MATKRRSRGKTKRVSKHKKDLKPLSMFLCSVTLLGILLYSSVSHSIETKQQDPEQIPRSVIPTTKIVFLNDNLKQSTKPKEFKSKPIDSKSVECLAKNIFHEARGTNKWEMIRVANVTMNRVKSGKYPKTVCSVVYQPYQFSWTLEQLKKYNPIPKLYKSKIDLQSFDLAKQIASRAISNDLPDLTKGALWYHTHEVNPKWNKKKEITVASNWHRYYKE